MPNGPIFHDLSHPITPDGPCTFVPNEHKPWATFEEGESHGFFFITSCLHNLPSNLSTHMDLPGHIVLGGQEPPMVGEQPLSSFSGRVIVLDVRDKLAEIGGYFDASGFCHLKPEDADSWNAFLKDCRSLEIDKDELIRRIDELNPTHEFDGVLFYCGNAGFWRPGHRSLATEYIYFYNVFLSDRAAQWLLRQGLRFVGIDSFQLEDPIINFRGDEAFAVRDEALRGYVKKRLSERELYSNHRTFLSAGVPIYENLNLGAEVAGKMGWFFGAPLNIRIPGVVDNALCRPVFLERLTE